MQSPLSSILLNPLSPWPPTWSPSSPILPSWQSPTDPPTDEAASAFVPANEPAVQPEVAHPLQGLPPSDPPRRMAADRALRRASADALDDFLNDAATGPAAAKRARTQGPDHVVRTEAALIRSATPPAPHATAAPVAAPPAARLPAPPLGPLRQKGLDTLVDWIVFKNWNSEAGDMAPQLLTRLPRWPAGRRLEVHDADGAVYAFGNTGEWQTPVRVWREHHHYSALVDGRLLAVPADGDCLFHAIVTAMGAKDAYALAGVDAGPGGNGAELGEAEMRRLAVHMRLALADHVRDNPGEVSPWVDLERMGAQAELPAASSRRWRVPFSQEQRLDRIEISRRQVALLKELQALAQENLLGRPSGAPLSAKLMKEQAAMRGLPQAPVTKWLSVLGHLTLAGSAFLQDAEHLEQGMAYNAADAALLRGLQARAKGPDRMPLSDRVIIDVALARNVSIRVLRTLIKDNGDLTQAGKNVMNGGGLSGTRRRFKPLTAAVLRELQPRLALGKDMAAEAERLQVSLDTLRKFMHRDGTLSSLGQSKIANDSASVTAEVLLAVQRTVRRGHSLTAVCREMNFEYARIRRFVRESGEFTIEGRNALYGDEQRRSGRTKQRPTAQLVIELFNLPGSGGLSKEEIFEFSRKHDLSFLTMAAYFVHKKGLSKAGIEFLRSQGIPHPELLTSARRDWAKGAPQSGPSKDPGPTA